MRYPIAGLIVLALVVSGLAALASCEPAPAEPTGVVLDIDRSKTRAPLKTAEPFPARKTRKAVKR